MARLEGTIQVKFSDGSSDNDYVFYVELDDVLNVDSSGESISQFPPGGKAYIDINHSSNIKIDEVVPTDGTIGYHSSDTRTSVDTMLAASRDQGDPDKHVLDVVSGSSSFKYFGRSGGFNQKSNSYGEITLEADTSLAPFYAEITTSFPVDIYMLNIPDMTLGEDEVYKIGIVFYISKV